MTAVETMSGIPLLLFEIEDGVRLAEVEVRSERHDEVRDGLRCDHGEARHQGSANERDPSRRSSRSNPPRVRYVP